MKKIKILNEENKNMASQTYEINKLNYDILSQKFDIIILSPKPKFANCTIALLSRLFFFVV